MFRFIIDLSPFTESATHGQPSGCHPVPVLFRNTHVAKTRQGRQSIYNICILNDCKLTFMFFKNYIFEKRRQFLNRLQTRV